MNLFLDLNWMGNIKRMYCLLWTHKFKKALKKMFSKSFDLFVINWNLQNKIAAVLQMDMTQTYRDQNWPWWNIKLDIWEVCPQSLDDPSGAPLLDFLAAWPKRRTALTYSEIYVFWNLLNIQRMMVVVIISSAFSFSNWAWNFWPFFTLDSQNIRHPNTEMFCFCL